MDLLYTLDVMNVTFVIYIYFTRVKNEKNLSELRGFLWIYLRHTVTIKEMENYLKQLVLLHLVLGYNSATGVTNISQWESIRKLQRKSVYKGSNSPPEQLKGISKLSEQQIDC